MSLKYRLSLSIAALLGPLLGLAPPARAEAPCEDRPRVQVQVESAARSALVRRTVDLVTAELTARSRPCESSADGERAKIVVRWLDASRVRIEVELHLSDRSQRAERDVDHARIPTDGIPAALAIAADELLRAVYEQAGIEAIEEPPSTPARPEIEETEPAPSTLAPPRANLLGFAMAAEIFPVHRALLGPDAHLAIPLGSELTLDARLGLRAIAPPFEASPRARLSRLWLAGLDIRWEFARSRAGVEVAAAFGADALVAFDDPLLRPALRAGPRASWELGARIRLDAGLDVLWLPMAIELHRGASPIAAGIGIAPSLGALFHF